MVFLSFVSRFNLLQSFNYANYIFYKKQFKTEINCFCIRTSDWVGHLSSSARNKGTDTIRKVVLKGYVRLVSMAKKQRGLPLGIKPICPILSKQKQLPVNFVRWGVDRSRVHLIGQFLVQAVRCLWELIVKLHFLSFHAIFQMFHTDKRRL